MKEPISGLVKALRSSTILIIFVKSCDDKTLRNERLNVYSKIKFSCYGNAIKASNKQAEETSISICERRVKRERWDWGMCCFLAQQLNKRNAKWNISRTTAFAARKIERAMRMGEKRGLNYVKMCSVTKCGAWHVNFANFKKMKRKSMSLSVDIRFLPPSTHHAPPKSH